MGPNGLQKQRKRLKQGTLQKLFNEYYKDKLIKIYIPVQQTSEFVTHIDNHDLFASTRELGDLTLHGFGHAAVDGTAKTTVR